MISTFKKATLETLKEVAEEMGVRRTKEVFVLFALGSQFDHLIKQAIEKLGVFCLVADPASVTMEDIDALNPKGIILSGGPASVYAETVPFDSRIFDLGIPVLGICLGYQLWAKHVGAQVVAASEREFGVHAAEVRTEDTLFAGCPMVMQVLESHGDMVIPTERFTILASTRNAAAAAAQCGHLWGVQFHPEVTETVEGPRIFDNFCFGICGAKDRFPAEDVAARKIEELRTMIGDATVLLALSGGSDSSVAAHLLKKAKEGRQGRIKAVYIKGIDRPDDEANVIEYFGNEPWLDLEIVDATEDFLEAVRGISSMAGKREVMRGVYQRILEFLIRKYGASFVIQGTLYTDISESGGGYGTGTRKAKIKQHHNTNLVFSVPEIMPLADCVKDGARSIGRAIGVPEDLLIRHPFPGPGRLVRIEGPIDEEKLRIEGEADAIWIEELRKAGHYPKVWQAAAVVTSSYTTCTQGDDAGTGVVIALWAVWSVNGFTAQAAELPWDFLKHVDQRICNEVRGVGSTVYRLTGKPPTTIEWG